MSHARILDGVKQYYTARIQAHGATPQGVDWNSARSQTVRFDQLARLCAGESRFSLLDYGCGYGAFYDYLQAKGIVCTYAGYDVAPAMIDAARRLHTETFRARFFAEGQVPEPADFVVASGIFNVRDAIAADEWHQYMQATVDELARLSTRGFAFNALTSYSDPDRMRPDLHYADPRFWFDRCEERYSRWVALLHDYGLYEFTLIVRKH